MANENSTCRVCIQAKKVFDACMRQTTNEEITVVVTSVDDSAVEPLTFISGRSVSSQGVVSNLSVERLPDRPQYGRVRCDVTIPVQITYYDATNAIFTGVGSVTLAEDVVMFLPEASVIPYEVEATVSLVCPQGRAGETSVVSGERRHEFIVITCNTVILKIVANADIIVPTYGYAVIPPAQDYANTECSRFFEMPLFPQSQT